MDDKTKLTLMKNWGEKATAMSCYVEIKYKDNLSSWACYVYAMNPENNDEISCIIDGLFLEVSIWSLKELLETYNAHGEFVIRDDEFRRVRASELFKTLSEGK